MLVVFISNYYNHHQAPLSKALYKELNGEYVFIETAPMQDERLNMGWSNKDVPSFVIRSYTDREACMRLIGDADILIYGDAPYAMIESRLKAGRLVFFYTERWYKRGFNYWKWPVRVIRHWLLYGRYHNTRLLSVGAFSAKDCAKTLLFRHKAYRWGYFPFTARYESIEKLQERKKPNSILWAGRMIGLKHPELALLAAKKLRQENYRFSLTMIGDGEQRESVCKLIEEYGLSDCVRISGFIEPDAVREYMERSEIFLCTSDQNEGWGVVVNESMNAGCAVISNSAVGAATYLLQNGKNGLVYSGGIDELYSELKLVLDDPSLRKRLGRNAYHTITQMWNAENAADRLVQLFGRFSAGEKSPDLFTEGPCSKA